MPRAKTDDNRDDPLSTELVCYPGDGLDGTDEQPRRVIQAGEHAAEELRRRQLWDTQRAGGWRSDEWCCLSAARAQELARDLIAAAQKVEARER